MHFDDSPREAAFRAEARAWLDRVAAPRTDEQVAIFAEDRDEPEVVRRAKEWQRQLADGGWAGITWPAEYGGRGEGLLEAMIFGEELARYDVPQRVVEIGTNLIGPTLIAHGTADQKNRYLPPMLRGDEIWCQLWSEPGAGSDLASLATRAELDDATSTWVLNGQKVWTSGAHYSQWGLGVFRSEPAAPKHLGISCLIVDMSSPGITVRPLRQMTGGANFNEVFFDDVRVPAENLVGERNDGWRVARTTLMHERFAVGSMTTPTRAFAPLAALVQARGATPVYRDELVRVYTLGRLFDLTTARVRTSVAQGTIPGVEGSILKLALAQLATAQAELAMRVQGTAAMLANGDAPEDGRWQAAFLGAPGVHLGGGTDQIQRNIIGERVLGLPREPAPATAG